MWVPTGEKKLTGTFEEKTVSHETTLEEKAPTERKIQERKEKVGTLWDEDEDMFCDTKVQHIPTQNMERMAEQEAKAQARARSKRGRSPCSC